MEEVRPDPEALLRQIKLEEKKKTKKGKCSIFLGYAAGVGKTYAMLEAAHELRKEGVDVVAAYIEPHARKETIAMAEGLETIAPLNVFYKGLELKELNIDAVLKRKPEIALVDELAHTNADGMRHKKRYEDIEELLGAGINVYTTVNIQHLESLNDIISSITGVHVKERVPDTFFDHADEVKIIDVEPEVLIERLKAGKIYKAVQAERALDHFFAREKLIALREIALRRTADRVNRIAIEENHREKEKQYYTGEHILTCISPSPTCMKVIRSASRLAYAFHAEFTALYVETPELQNADVKTKKMVEDNMHLAKALGAKLATVFGEDVAFQIAEYARVCKASKIVLGRTNHRIWFGQKKGTLTDQISSYNPDMDVYIIPDTRARRSERKTMWSRPEKRKTGENGKVFIEFLKVAAVMGVITCIGLYMEELGLIFLFLFAFLISLIITKQKRQARETAKLMYRTELLLENSKRMRRVHSVQDLLSELSEQVLKLMGLSVIFFVKKEGKVTGPWMYPRTGVEVRELKQLYDNDEKAVVQWVMENRRRAGCCTHTLPNAKAMYLPIRSGEEIYGVMGIVLEEKREIPTFEYALLTAMLNEAALVFERIYLIEGNEK